MLGDSLLSSATFPRGGRHFRDLSVDRASNKAWVGIALHQRVDLQLGFVERRRGWTRDHVLVDNVTHSRIQRNLIKIRFFFYIRSATKRRKIYHLFTAESNEICREYKDSVLSHGENVKGGGAQFIDDQLTLRCIEGCGLEHTFARIHLYTYIW